MGEVERRDGSGGSETAKVRTGLVADSGTPSVIS